MDLLFDPPQAFQGTLVPDGGRLAGWAALVHGLGIAAPVRRLSCVAPTHVRGSQRIEGCWHIFDKRYWPGERLTDHLGFALRHEPIDLLVLKRVFDAAPARDLEELVDEAPTGAIARRLWFFYELLTGERLSLDDAQRVAAVDALDPRVYFTARPRLSKRHRVRDNLLGNVAYCPVIRRTEVLGKFATPALADQAAETIGRTGGHLLARAASFLLLADSRASFEIEGERPPRNRLERWGRAVLQAGRNPLSLAELDRLHGVLIEDTRFSTAGLRPDGIFLGMHGPDGDPLPEFIGARPQELTSLLEGLVAANERMHESEIDPVLQAAATAFGFVYIHPYQDGNGRLHRCLIHHVLAERRFTPPGMVFPVSSVMLDRIDNYRETLRSHSGPLMDFIQWRPTLDRNVEVLNDTGDLYRYFDCTEAAEFLYACVARTVEHDLPDEIESLRRHDELRERILEIVEMPDRLVQDLMMFMRQNGGRLARGRREREFAALTDHELARIEEHYSDVFPDATAG